jgi:hypothetical protein
LTPAIEEEGLSEGLSEGFGPACVGDADFIAGFEVRFMVKLLIRIERFDPQVQFLTFREI